MRRCLVLFVLALLVASCSSDDPGDPGDIVETVSRPDTPSGPSHLNPSVVGVFMTGGAVSNYGHAVEYRFDLGAGSLPWTSETEASRAWSALGDVTIRSQARCTVDTLVLSSWSVDKTVTVAHETISKPDVPTGPASLCSGQSYDVTAGGAVSDFGHPIEYRFNWGDGSSSEWSAADSDGHAWAAGEYPVVTQARCAIDTDAALVPPAQSDALNVTVGEVITFDISGPSTVSRGQRVTYCAANAKSSCGNDVNVAFAVTGGTLSGRGGECRQWTAPLVPDLYRMTVTVRSGVGGEAVKTFDITVP